MPMEQREIERLKQLKRERLRVSGGHPALQGMDASHLPPNVRRNADEEQKPIVSLVRQQKLTPVKNLAYPKHKAQSPHGKNASAAPVKIKMKSRVLSGPNGTPGDRKQNASHTDMLKRLYVGEKKTWEHERAAKNLGKQKRKSIPDAQPALKRASSQHISHGGLLPTTTASEAIRTAPMPRSGNDSPFQRTSRLLNSVPKRFDKVKTKHETTLNDIDLNLLSRARASSSPASVSAPSSNGLPVKRGIPQDIKEEVMQSLGSSEPSPEQKRRKLDTESPRKSRTDNSTVVTPNSVRTTSKYVPSPENKELVNLLSSRLKKRNILFDKTSDSESIFSFTRKEPSGTKLSDTSDNGSSTPKKLIAAISMRLPSMQSIVKGLVGNSHETVNTMEKETCPVDENCFSKDHEQAHQLNNTVQQSFKEEGATEKLRLRTEFISNRLNESVPQLDLTTKSQQASPKSEDLFPSNEQNGLAASQYEDVNSGILAEEASAFGSDAISLQNTSSKIPRLSEMKPTEETGILVALSDDSSEASSRTSSSGNYVDNFQLMNNMKSRAVGHKIGTWNRFDKRKFLDLMDYLVVGHKPLSENPFVSCCNDICNVKNYENVEVHHLQKLPARLKFMELDSPLLGSLRPSGKANKKLDTLRKHDLYNGSAQKRRTRNSNTDGERDRKEISAMPVEVPEYIVSNDSSEKHIVTTKPEQTTYFNLVQQPLVNTGSSPLRESSSVPVNVPTLSTDIIDRESNFSVVANNSTTGRAKPADLSYQSLSQNGRDTVKETFDVNACNDIEELRKEYLLLKASIERKSVSNRDSKQTQGSDLTRSNDTAIIQQLTDEVIKSEMKVASFVGVNKQLQEKIKAMEESQNKLFNKVSTLSDESENCQQQTSKTGTVQDVVSSEIESDSRKSHSKLIHKVEKDLLELEALNKAVANDLDTIRPTKKTEEPDLTLLEEFKSKYEEEKARYEAQLSLERTRVSNLRAALLTKQGADGYLHADKGHIKDLEAQLQSARDAIRDLFRSLQVSQKECSQFKEKYGESAHKYEDLNTKYIVMFKDWSNVKNSNEILKLKLRELTSLQGSNETLRQKLNEFTSLKDSNEDLKRRLSHFTSLKERHEKLKKRLSELTTLKETNEKLKRKVSELSTLKDTNEILNQKVSELAIVKGSNDKLKQKVSELDSTLDKLKESASKPGSRSEMPTHTDTVDSFEQIAVLIKSYQDHIRGIVESLNENLRDSNRSKKLLNARLTSLMQKPEQRRQTQSTIATFEADTIQGGDEKKELKILENVNKELDKALTLLRHHMKPLKKIQRFVGPLAAFCEKEKIPHKSVLARLQWVEKLELTIIRMSKELETSRQTIAELETLNVKYEQQLHPQEKDDSDNKAKPRLVLSALKDDPASLKETIVRLLKERKSLLNRLKQQSDSKDKAADTNDDQKK